MVDYASKVNIGFGPRRKESLEKRGIGAMEVSAVVARPARPDVLRDARSRLGLAQPRMAALLDVSLRQYQRWEGGTSTPREREWVRIVDKLQLDMSAHGRSDALTQLERELAELRHQVESLRSELRRLETRLEPAEHVA